MSTAELQDSIFNKFLVYKTTEEQKAIKLEGLDQIAKGNFFTNEQVEKEIDEWLN
jgi:predicted transcriptional regulator